MAESIIGLTYWLKMCKCSNASSSYVASKTMFAMNNTADYLDNSNIDIVLAVELSRELKERSKVYEHDVYLEIKRRMHVKRQDHSNANRNKFTSGVKDCIQDAAKFSSKVKELRPDVSDEK